MRRILPLIVLLNFVVVGCAAPPPAPASASAPSAHSTSLPPSEATLKKAIQEPDSWYASEAGQRLVDHIVSWQNPNGGWWKKYDPGIFRPAVLPPPSTTDGPPDDTEVIWRSTSTFDNTATYTEMRIIARAHRITGKDAYAKSFLRGLDFIFKSQYPNGGWPQRFPLENNYGRRITFNDDAMTGVMALLHDIAEDKPDFTFIDANTRQRCRDAFARGLDCTLKCQMRINGKLTVWCQQYDEKTLQPASARRYELPGLTAAESSNIIMLLMQLEKPSPRIREAILAACEWYRANKILGKRLEIIHGPELPHGKDLIVVDDPHAGPIWARFYDLVTMKPFFVARDGIKRDSLAEISWERRNNYGWYGTWGKKVLAEEITWSANQNPPATTQAASAAAREIIVASDGTGAFKDVQSAIDSLAQSDGPHTILIRPGTYKQRVHVPKDLAFLTLRGSDADPTKTVLSFDLNANMIDRKTQQKVGTSGSASTLVDANDFSAENLTFENTAGDKGQAVALRLTADRASFKNCRFLGWQDTLYVDGLRGYFRDCYIEGRVDFIFGKSTAVFEDCVIHSKNGGYVTAARTPQEVPFGFVFLNCKLTGEGAMAYLGRPWRPWAAVAYLNCNLGDHIFPAGWDNWRNPDNEKTARYCEYHSTGAGANPAARVKWSHQLTDAQASRYTVLNVLSGPDHWKPVHAN